MKNKIQKVIEIVLIISAIITIIACKLPQKELPVAYNSKADLNTHYVYIEEE